MRTESVVVVQKENKNNTNRRINIWIVFIIILVMYVASIFVLIVFRNCIFTSINTQDFSYVGALLGGGLGGLGTLITLFLTVRDARETQIKSEEFQRQENEKNRKEEFIMEVAKTIGDYEASQAKYFFGCMEIKKRNNSISEREKISNTSENDPLISRWRDEINTIRFSDEGLRVAENRDYFVLRTMLGDIENDNAKALLKSLDEIHYQEEAVLQKYDIQCSEGKWLSQKRRDLEKWYFALKKDYLQDEYM